jgi:hypothetical protein
MDGAAADDLLALARLASLNPSVMFHLKFLGTIVACRSRYVSTLSRCLTVSRKAHLRVIHMPEKL